MQSNRFKKVNQGAIHFVKTAEAPKPPENMFFKPEPKKYDTLEKTFSEDKLKKTYGKGFKML